MKQMTCLYWFKRDLFGIIRRFETMLKESNIPYTKGTCGAGKLVDFYTEKQYEARAKEAMIANGFLKVNDAGVAVLP